MRRVKFRVASRAFDPQGSKRARLLSHRAPPVRPALAEPAQLPSGNRCLTNEARARGLHAGPSAKALNRGRFDLRSLSCPLTVLKPKDPEITKRFDQSRGRTLSFCAR